MTFFCFRKTGFWAFAPVLFLLPALLAAQPRTSLPPSGSPLFRVQANKGYGRMNGALAAPEAVLSLAGPDTLCAGQRDTLRIDFTGGDPPFTFVYSINGFQQAPLTTNNNPYIFLTPIFSPGTQVIQLDSMSANGIPGAVSGMDTVVVLPVPTAQLISDTLYHCAGQTDTLRIRFTGPAPYTFIYAAGKDTMPPLSTSDTLYKIPVTPPTGFTVYTLIDVMSGGCSGPVNGSFAVLASTPPTATLSGDTVVCAGESVPLTIAFTGEPPFGVNYTANGVPQPPDTLTANPSVWVVSPGTSVTYELTSVQTGGCPGTVSGQAVVTVNPGLSAEISGGGQICQGGSGTTVTITFQGAGPYTFQYSAGNDTLPPVTTSTNPYVIAVNPPVGTIYRLVSLTNGVCTGIVSGAAVVAVFTPSTAFLSGDMTFCNQADTTVMVDFTGSGPFVLVYSANSVVQPTVETFDDPYFIPVNITSTTTYELLSVESPGCIGTVIGDATVTINYPPSFGNLQFNCDSIAGTYTIEFDALSAKPPMTLVSGSGSFVGITGTHFISTPLPIAQAYNFVFHDTNDCGDVQVSGQSGCFCATDAGSMNLTPLHGCAGGNVLATHNGNQVLDNTDTLLFILHTNPSLPAGQILAWSATPGFAFGPGMQTGVTYYISAIAGNPDPMGHVDLSDPCLSVAQGVPVLFHELPLAQFDLVGPACPGDTINVSVSLSGTAPFQSTYALNGSAQPPINSAGSPAAISVPVSDPTVLTLVSLSDTYCSNMPADTVALSFLQPPALSNLTVVCQWANGTYTIEFDAAGQPPFTVNGLGGSFNAAHFTSDPIPAAQAYAFTLSDANNCGEASASGISNCVCLTDAGTMSLTPVNVCAGAILSAVYNNDAALEAGDTLAFVLHTGSGAALGTVLDIQASPDFLFQPGVTTTGVTYYISAIAGNNDGLGSVDLMDPCLSVSPGTPVSWLPLPTATMDATFDVCPGQQVFIPVTFTGKGPYTFTYTSNGQPNTVMAALNSYSIGATLLSTTNYLPVSVVDAQCAGTVAGQATVTVHQAPVISNINVVCAPDNLSYTVDFDVLNADWNTLAIAGSVTGAFDPASGHFTSNPIPAQTGYSAIVTDSWQCGLDSISGGANCSCTTSAGTMDAAPLTLCYGDSVFTTAASNVFLGPGDILLYALVTTPSPVTWNIVAWSATPAFAFDPGAMAPATTYYIVALAGNQIPGGIDLNDLCLSFALGASVRWQPPASVVLGADTDICAGDTANLVLLFSGNPPFSAVYQVNGVDQPAINPAGASYTLPVSPAANAVYTLASGTANGCPAAVSGSAAVSVHALPVLLNPQTICDLSTETYTVTFAVSNGADPNPVYSVSGVQGSFIDTVFTSLPIAGDQPFALTVSTPQGCTAALSGAGDCVCTTDAGTLGSAGPLSVCLPDAAAVQPGNGAVLQSGDLLQYILYASTGTLPQNILALSSSPQFSFQAGMQTETLYFISAIAGDSLPDGSIDLTDPCLSISPAVPVVFHNRPTATLAGDTTICVSNSTAFKIQFTGKAPFQFVYAINGSQQSGVSAPQNSFAITTNNVQQSQLFTLVSVQDAFCSGTVSGSYTVNIQPGPTASFASGATICAGDSIALGLQLGGGSSYNLTINGGAQPLQLTGVQNGATVTVAPPATTTYTIGALVAQGNNCPAMIGPGVTVQIAPPISTTAVLSDYGGFQIGCPGEADGSIQVSPSGGIPPVTASWSNGSSGPLLQGLREGSYAVTLTDNIGCTFADTFLLTAPAPLSVDIDLQTPACKGARNGALTILQVSGGVGPFALSLNGGTAQIADVFPVSINNLPAGDYALSVADINGCETMLQANIADPPLFTVDLGPDTLVFIGDSILLEALLSDANIDSFFWSPLAGLQTPDALSTFAKPLLSTTYRIWVKSAGGCIAEDAILVAVRNEKRVYLPNAFKPGAGAENGRLTVYAGPEVALLRSMRVYDRWGACVFEGLDLEPNQPAQGWDGRWRGQDVPPGVYVCVVELEYTDGSTEVKSGDVTVVR